MIQSLYDCIPVPVHCVAGCYTVVYNVAHRTQARTERRHKLLASGCDTYYCESANAPRCTEPLRIRSLASGSRDDPSPAPSRSRAREPTLLALSARPPVAAVRRRGTADPRCAPRS
eukprot:scaffold17254_cov99-Isochrysis_galbana.AAC.4